MYVQQPSNFQAGRHVQAFTIIELLVTIAVIGIVVGLLLPALQIARISSDNSQCANNLHYIGIGYQAFVDNNGRKTSAFIGDAEWTRRLLPYVENRQVFVCPSQKVYETSAAYRSQTDNAETSPLHKDGRIIFTLNADGTLTWNGPAEKQSLQNDGGPNFVIISPISNSQMPSDPSAFKSSTIASQSSYGVSNAAQYIGALDSSQKVLVIEYKELVANVVGVSALDFWPQQCAPRHHGTLNILFGDGSVGNKTPYEIDPRVDEIYKTHWLPQLLMD
jgi:prepilin-type N-terminal cleavage/methylation domain-containing protein/prepilin-type processing-associated H-X9-DG protein